MSDKPEKPPRMHFTLRGAKREIDIDLEKIAAETRFDFDFRTGFRENILFYLGRPLGGVPPDESNSSQPPRPSSQ